MKWWLVIIVCLIFSMIAEPVNRRISNKVKKKWLAYILSLAIDMCILLLLYGIAAILGFSIYE